MGQGISIITSEDDYLEAITKMSDVNQAFQKDVTGLQSKLDVFNIMKATLNVDFNKAKNELKKVEEQFGRTGEAADRLKLVMANAKYENARKNLSLVSDNAKQAEKDMINLVNTNSKAENRAGIKGALGSIDKAGLMKMFGGSLLDVTNTFVNSAYGSETGTMVSSILSSAVSGAEMGAIGGVPGILIGAVTGGVSGAISGAAKNFEKKDDAFKQYYQEQYNSLQEEQKNTLARGTETAASREMDRLSFSRLLGGDENASAYLEDLTQFAVDTPFAYEDLTQVSKTMLKNGYKQNEILSMLTKVGDAGSALGMTTEDITMVTTALSLMKSTGKTSLEYINPLLERGIPVWDYLAKASGKTNKQVQEMVEKGLIPGQKAAKDIADYMGADFAGNMAKQSGTYAGLLSNVNEAQTEVESAMGEGYTEERKKGLKEQQNYFSGDSGVMVKEANKQIGQWNAHLENLSEEYGRDALTAVMKGEISSKFDDPIIRDRLKQMNEEYKRLSVDNSEESGAKMGALIKRAKAIGQNEFNASDDAQQELEVNKNLANNLKNDAGLKDAYWDAGWQMGEQFSLGLASAVLPKIIDAIRLGTTTKIGPFNVSRNSVSLFETDPIFSLENKKIGSNSAIEPYPLSSFLNGDIGISNGNSFIKSDPLFSAYNNATVISGGSAVQNDSNPIKYGLGPKKNYGVSYMPYDNFPALLHEGERVSTASENRNYGKDASATITGNNFYIREEADIQKIAKEIVRQFKNAYTLIW